MRNGTTHRADAGKEERFVKTSRLLFHVCCAPCAVLPLERLLEEWHVTVWWFNPNIRPLKEYISRLSSVLTLVERTGVPLLGRFDYNPALFAPAAREGLGEGGGCGACYSIRLESAAREAARLGFDAFSTSLLISPYQRHLFVRERGEALGARFGVRFLYEDWRPLYRAGRERAAAEGFYLQKYCGCLFSERERWSGRYAKVLRRASRLVDRC